MVPRLLTLYSEPQSMSEGNGATPPRCLGDRHPLFTGWVNGDWIVITEAGCFARGETAGWQEAAITGRCHWHNQVPALLYSWSVSESLGDVRCRLPNAHLSAPPGVIIQPAGQECFFYVALMQFAFWVCWINRLVRRPRKSPAGGLWRRTGSLPKKKKKWLMCLEYLMRRDSLIATYPKVTGSSPSPPKDGK